MTCLVSIIQDDGTFFREFLEVPHRVERGDMLHAFGTYCRVLTVVQATTTPGDPEWEQFEIYAKPDFTVEIIAAPVCVNEFTKAAVALEGGMR